MSDAPPIHTKFGCVTPQTHDFVKRSEFISLGCYCPVANALKLLGVRKHAYPFDWLRSPIDGIRHCLRTDFEDFLTYTYVKDDEESGLKFFANARWGGSFWHHNIENEDVQKNFERRVDRFLGLAEIPKSKPKVFVRIPNSTRELDEVLDLMELLKCKFPDAPIYLLILVDMQEDLGPKCVEGLDDSRVLFYFLPTDFVYKPGARGAEDINFRSAAYAQIIAFAVRLWSGGIAENRSLHRFPDMARLAASCTQWDGGNCAIELFAPRLFRGSLLASKGRAASTLPKLLHGREGHIILQANSIDTGMLTLDVFGTERTFHVPETANVGDVMKFRLVNHILTVVLITAQKGLPCSA